MGNVKDGAAIGVNLALVGITARMSDIEELHALDLEMQARHKAGEVLSDEEVDAHFAKADKALDDLQAQIDAARAARTK